MTVEEIRKEAKKNCVPLWKIADALGISEPTMSRLLRHDLSEEKEAQILDIIRKESKSHE